MSVFSNMEEQPQVAVDSMAKTLYSSGLLIKAAEAGSKYKDSSDKK